MGERSSGIGLLIFGAIFWVCAAYFIYCGFITPTTVPNPAGGEEVANLQAMHVQGLNFQLGIGAAVLATIFTCTSAIVAKLGPDRRPS